MIYASPIQKNGRILTITISVLRDLAFPFLAYTSTDTKASFALTMFQARNYVGCTFSEGIISVSAQNLRE